MKKIKVLGRFRDQDKTEKFVFKSGKGIIEITWIKNKSGIAVFCLPTHHYCNLGCKFCHLTESGVKKKMIPISLTDMVGAMNFILDSYISDKSLLFSFMGVGEPFLNIKLIFEFYDYLKNNVKKNIGLALASMILSPGPLKKIIEKVKNENLPLKIHFSLHSPVEKIRKDIIPLASTAIPECLRALENYGKLVFSRPPIVKNLKHFHKRPDAVEVHYTLIDKINDSDEDLEKIIKIGNKYRIPLKLLKFNPTEYLSCSPRVDFWFKRLSEKYGAPVYLYFPPGPNIGSSCGQFTKHYYLSSNSKKDLKEFRAWKGKYEIPL